MGDFNFIASKENTLCKDFIEIVSQGKQRLENELIRTHWHKSSSYTSTLSSP